MKPHALLKLIALTALAALVLTACGSKDPQPGTEVGGVYGTWKGDGSSLTDPTAKSMTESMSLTLKEDKSFSGFDGRLHGRHGGVRPDAR